MINIMAKTSAVTVTIPPELLASLQRYAEKNGRSIQDVAEEAMRMLVDDEEMTDIRRYHVLRAETLGLSLDDYVMTLVKEDRRERREQQAA